ncbi:MAG: hypothetical protein PHO55_08800 [Thiomonas arsenitoxydans]|jgi:hypothetical protein|nr:hypothetical protein [Thiomonas arsenitoxydans]
MAENLLKAQRFLALVGVGAYRGDLEGDAAQSAAAIEFALPIAPMEQRESLDGARLTLRVMASGGMAPTDEIKSAVYVLHRFLSEQFPSAHLGLDAPLAL